MDKIANSMRLEFPSLADNVGLARVVVASFAAQLDFTLEELEEIKVAVSEAVTNAIVHGYQQKPVGLITITANRSDTWLEIVVSDNGKGMTQAEQILSAGGREGQGLGFIFMQSLMDEVRVDSASGQGTAVTLVKRLKNMAQAVALQS